MLIVKRIWICEFGFLDLESYCKVMVGNFVITVVKLLQSELGSGSKNKMKMGQSYKLSYTGNSYCKHHIIELTHKSRTASYKNHKGN